MRSLHLQACALLITLPATLLAADGDQSPLTAADVPFVQPYNPTTVEEVNRAESNFWRIFQSADYPAVFLSHEDPTTKQQMPPLFEQLRAARKAAGSNIKASALMDGRIGFALIWISAEWNDALGVNDDLPMNDVFSSWADRLKVPVGERQSGRGLPRQLAGIYFKRAALQIVKADNGKPVFDEHHKVTLRPEWAEPTSETQADKIPLPLRTFPAVACGFFATTPNAGPLHFTMQSTYGVVPHSLGFNFATPTLGADAPRAQLGPLDVSVMWQLAQLGTKLDNVALYSASKSHQAKIFSKQTYGDFYRKYPTFHPYVPVTPERPTVSKSSVGSSDVVPFNYETSLMLLGDAMVATYAPQPSIGPHYWETPFPPTKEYSAKDVVAHAYLRVKQSPLYHLWPHKESITQRLEHLDDVDTLYHLAQNRPGKGGGYTYAYCMSCHQSR